jgi:SAM-dependent methyltransferase
MFRHNSLERRAAPSIPRHERLGTGSITATSLRFADHTIRAVARREGPRESLAALCLRSACRELMLRVGRRVNFRQAENQAACRAYDAMRIDDFRDINALQAWANWRTIPRNLNGELPNRPILAIDLCSGTGDSTAVLAYYCAPGSQILGLEFNPNFVAYARCRHYVDRRRQPADVAFTVQSVLEAFRLPNGDVIADESADLINAAGAVGCHFDRAATRTLARECGRVVRPGGLAMIDAGRGGAEVRDLLAAFTAEGFTAVRQSRSCLFDLGRQVCLRKCEQ